MKKRLLSVLLAAVMVLGLAACGASEEPAEEAVESTEAEAEEVEIGKVIIGTDGTYPPFNYMDENGELTGFEIEMVNEIAKRAGLEVEYQTLPWDGIFGQMDSGKIDTVLCCIFPNAERQEKYLFSSEYIYDENRFIALKENAAEIKEYEDLAGKKVGVSGGGNSYDVLYAFQQETGIDFEIVPYNTENFVNDCALGRLDVIYKSPVSAFEQQKSLGVEFDVAPVPAVEKASCAIPWRKDDARSAAICEKFSEATKAMIEDGTMKELSEKWLGMDLSVYEPLCDF